MHDVVDQGLFGINQVVDDVLQSIGKAAQARSAGQHAMLGGPY